MNGEWPESHPVWQYPDLLPFGLNSLSPIELEFPSVAGHFVPVARVRVAKLNAQIALLPKHHTKVQDEQRRDKQEQHPVGAKKECNANKEKCTALIHRIPHVGE